MVLIVKLIKHEVDTVFITCMKQRRKDLTGINIQVLVRVHLEDLAASTKSIHRSFRKDTTRKKRSKKAKLIAAAKCMEKK